MKPKAAGFIGGGGGEGGVEKGFGEGSHGRPEWGAGSEQGEEGGDGLVRGIRT